MRTKTTKQVRSGEKLWNDIGQYRVFWHSVLAFIVLSFFFATTSCVPRKQLAYFQTSTSGDTSFSPIRQQYQLQPGDVLSIRFTSQDPNAVAPFGAENVTSGGQQITNLQLFVNGYSVSDSGTISVPVLGIIRTRGLTIQQTEEKTQNLLDKYVRGAIVKARLVSYKISVLGEVRNPNTIYIYNERLTLPEALGYAGDLTDLGDRKNIRLIRNRDGKVIIRTLDLTDRKLLGSPDFYIQPNDVLYVQPIASKADRLNLPALGVGLSALTTILVVLNLVIGR